MTEMRKLINLLTDAGIPHEVVIQSMTGTEQVWYPSREDAVCDVICHEYSYGGDKGLLEIMGLVHPDLGDDVEGYMTANEVFLRIDEHYRGELDWWDYDEDDYDYDDSYDECGFNPYEGCYDYDC